MRVLNYFLVFLLFIMVSGHFLHWFFDRSNTLYREELGGYDSTETFLLIYFADEFLAHGMIHVSYYFILMIYVALDIIDKREKTLKWEEYIFSIGTGIGIGVINGEAALKGESALVLFILSLTGFIILIFIIIKKKFSIKKYPMLFSMLLGCLIVILHIIFYIQKNKLIPVYPYIT